MDSKKLAQWKENFSAVFKAKLSETSRIRKTVKPDIERDVLAVMNQCTRGFQVPIARVELFEKKKETGIFFAIDETVDAGMNYVFKESNQYNPTEIEELLAILGESVKIANSPKRMREFSSSQRSM